MSRTDRATAGAARSGGGEKQIVVLVVVRRGMVHRSIRPATDRPRTDPSRASRRRGLVVTRNPHKSQSTSYIAKLGVRPQQSHLFAVANLHLYSCTSCTLCSLYSVQLQLYPYLLLTAYSRRR